MIANFRRKNGIGGKWDQSPAIYLLCTEIFWTTDLMKSKIFYLESKKIDSHYIELGKTLGAKNVMKLYFYYRHIIEIKIALINGRNMDDTRYW